MNKKISTSFAFIVILLVSVLVLFMYWMSIEKNKSGSKIIQFNRASKGQKKCSIHAYQGESKIRVWKDKEYSDENGIACRVAEQDLKELPKYDGTENFKSKNSIVKLVQMTPAIEDKLKNSSEKNPVKIIIKGFATRCDGISLASVEYKDGIFRNYLDD